MRRVALTGGIATGKSHVRGVFEQLGVPTIDADILARRAVQPGTPGLSAVLARFGPEMLNADGTLDRARLASLVFTDARARADLEAIVHPIVRTEIAEWFAALDVARHPCAIADVPLLYETGRDRDFDAVIVTACEPATQLLRLMERDHATEAEARRRIGAQLPLDEKVRRADYVIRTDGSFEETDRQVRDVYNRLLAA